MNSKQESASGWLGKSMAEAKGAYLSASLMTILSAGCFVAFSWYLSDFAASWLVDGQVLAHKLLYAVAFITGRYVFAHFLTSSSMIASHHFTLSRRMQYRKIVLP